MAQALCREGQVRPPTNTPAARRTATIGWCGGTPGFNTCASVGRAGLGMGRSCCQMADEWADRREVDITQRAFGNLVLASGDAAGIHQVVEAVVARAGSNSTDSGRRVRGVASSTGKHDSDRARTCDSAVQGSVSSGQASGVCHRPRNLTSCKAGKRDAERIHVAT